MKSAHTWTEIMWKNEVGFYEIKTANKIFLTNIYVPYFSNKTRNHIYEGDPIST